MDEEEQEEFPEFEKEMRPLKKLVLSKVEAYPVNTDLGFIDYSVR
jgi:hypothetical protein